MVVVALVVVLLVMIALSAVRFPVFVVFVLTVFALIVLPVKFDTVVDASVDEPETARLVKVASVALSAAVNSELKVAKIPLKPTADEVPVSVVEPKFPVLPLYELKTAALPATVPPVKLVTVVEPSVDEPETERLAETIGLAVVRVPET